MSTTIAEHWLAITPEMIRAEAVNHGYTLVRLGKYVDTDLLRCCAVGALSLSITRHRENEWDAVKRVYKITALGEIALSEGFEGHQLREPDEDGGRPLSDEERYLHAVGREAAP